MKLFSYEMKKLLFNKKRLILLAVMFLLYGFLGFSMVWSETASSVDVSDKMTERNLLMEKNTGTFNPEQFEQSAAIMTEAIAQYGKGEPLQYQMNRNPVLQFHNQYMNYGQKVNAYWNGPEEQNSSDIKGVYPLQEKLAALEAVGQTETFEYRNYSNRLEDELAIGEPVFVEAKLWNAYSIKADPMLFLILLLMPLAYFISPLFTQEVKTEMDNIVLCSLKGRCEIVTAKLCSATASSIIIAVAYFLAFFIGVWIGCGNLAGFDAPARVIGMFSAATMNTSVLIIMLLGDIWLLLVVVAYGLCLALISSLLKSQSAAFGIGIVVLFGGLLSGNLPASIQKVIWPVVDFNYSALANVGAVFNNVKIYNAVGMPVLYGLAALFASAVLIAAAALLTYLVQKKRSAV